MDVIGTYFDGKHANIEASLDYILDCMWDLDKAAEHAQRFTGYIPCSNETLIDLIDKVKENLGLNPSNNIDATITCTSINGESYTASLKTN